MVLKAIALLDKYGIKGRRVFKTKTPGVYAVFE
jgi:hypothetical protein